MLLSVTLSNTALMEKDEILTKIVAGAYWRELPDSIVYEATIPLTYKANWISGKIDTFNDSAYDSKRILFNDTKESFYAFPINLLVNDLNKKFDEQLDVIETSLDPHYFINKENKLNQNRKKKSFAIYGRLL